MSVGVAVLREAVDQTVAVAPCELTDRELADELLALRRELDRLEGQFARLAAAGHVRGIGTADGAASTAAWLRHHAGMRTGDAKAAIRAGDTAELLQETGEAWRSGEITGGAARTIFGARVDGYDGPLVASEPVLLDLARQGDHRAVKIAADQCRTLARAEGTAPREHDGLTLARTYDGTLYLQGELSDDAAEIVATALHAYTDPPSEGDTRSTARRYADALTEICEVAIAHAADRGRPVPEILVVIDWNTLTQSIPGRTDGQHTGSLHPDTIRELLCDSAVTRILTGPDSQPIDVGRSRRTIPPATRRAVIARDGGCRYPGCTRPPGWCQIHHVIAWTDGGLTILTNLVMLCAHHHHVIHQPGWTLKFDGIELRVIRPDGVEVT